MSDSTGHLVPRRILDVALQRHAESPVLLLEGPRAVGKSTLLRQLAERVGGRILDLDDLDTRTAVARDPATMIDGDQVVLIDEYQHAAVVLDAIKARLNTTGRPGQFILTGSARHEALPRAAQALTGRLQRLPVLPLAQSELRDVRADLLPRLLTDPDAVVAAAARPTSTTTRDDYAAMVARGGFPMARAAATDRARGRWIDDYVGLTLERDAQELSKVRQAHTLPLILERAAGQTAQVLNTARMAHATGIDGKTARDYLRLLEAVFLLRILPAWDRTLTKRTNARPKVHMLDTGVSSRLLRLTPEKLARREPAALTEFGHALETFAVGEILKEASWTDDIVDHGHWRTRDDEEVDLVLESDDGGIIGFEIKAAARTSRDDFAGLRKLRDTLGATFVAGVVLYTGPRSYTYDDRLHVMAIDRIWTP
ncbi:ATP-binding protein [Isoptericola rhizosphaerae]|uniref:ATP-binding protein n=1 Tax=Isoptericola rhizosphaerae TaxID=3377837 RepID=UPI00383A09C4